MGHGVKVLMHFVFWSDLPFIFYYSIISSLYKAYGQKDKCCAERYTIFQPRMKS